MQTKDQQRAMANLRKARNEVTAAKKAVKAVEKKRLLPAIRAAHDEGVTLRDIGESLGVSHVTVMRMMRE